MALFGMDGVMRVTHVATSTSRSYQVYLGAIPSPVETLEYATHTLTSLHTFM